MRNLVFCYVLCGVCVDELFGFGRRVIDSASESSRFVIRGCVMVVVIGGCFVECFVLVKLIGCECLECCVWC